MRTILMVASVALCFLYPSGLAQAQILNQHDIDALCRSAPPVTSRSTIVYVDISSIKTGDDEWGYTILKKLELGPREHLTVLGVNPTTFEVLDVFDSCFPTLSTREIDQIRQARSYWDKLTLADPETQQRDNLQTFDARLRNSLDRLQAASKKYVAGKRRNILGAIAVDKNRIKNGSLYHRIVIYSDGVLSDEFESVSDIPRTTEFLTKRYPANFAGSHVWVFGISGDGRGASLEEKERVFSAFFLNGGAHVQSFALSLPQQSGEIISSVNILSGSFEGGGIKGTAKLFLAVTRARPAAVWLAFLVGTSSLYVPLEGEYSCDQQSCKLKAASQENVPLLSASPYFRKGDQLSLTGSQEKLSGSIVAGVKEVFSGGAEEVKYRLELSKQ